IIAQSGGALIDVDGDAAGTIEMDAGGANASGVGISLGNGTALRGDGTSSFTNGGEFTDGGTVVLNATAGSIFDSAAITVAGTNDAHLKANGSSSQTSGGDGGDIELCASGTILVTSNSSLNAIQASAGPTFDGDGGFVSFDSGDVNSFTIGPLDGDITIGAGIIQNGGGGSASPNSGGRGGG